MADVAFIEIDGDRTGFLRYSDGAVRVWDEKHIDPRLGAIDATVKTKAELTEQIKMGTKRRVLVSVSLMKRLLRDEIFAERATRT